MADTKKILTLQYQIFKSQFDTLHATLSALSSKYKGVDCLHDTAKTLLSNEVQAKKMKSLEKIEEVSLFLVPSFYCLFVSPFANLIFFLYLSNPILLIYTQTLL